MNEILTVNHQTKKWVTVDTLSASLSKWGIFGLLLIILLGVLLPSKAAAAEATSGTWGDLYWKYSQGELTISGNGPMEDLLSLYDSPWAHLSESVHTLQLQEGITAIGDCSFTNFTKLATVRLPDSLTRIGVAAFSGCSNLTWIFNSELVMAIPDNVKTIDIGAFANCTGLTALNLGMGVEYIGPSAFSDCYHLCQVTLSPRLTTLDNYAFYQCQSLTELTFPDTLSSIGDRAFYGCAELTLLRFTGDAPNISPIAFESPSPITAVVSYPEENDSWSADKRVGYGGNLTWQGIPAGYIAYGNCGDQVTWGMDQTGILTISGTGPMYDYDTINYPPWYSLKDQITAVVVENGVTTIGSTAFYKCTQITDISLPDTVTAYGYAAFFDCDSLTSFYIGPNITSIDEVAFLTCSGLEIFTVDKNNSCFASDSQGCLYNKDMTLLIQVPCMLTGHLEIPRGVTKIGDSAADDCVNITSVTIPSTVSSIGNGAFLFCRSLESIVIPRSVVLIDHGAFWCCMNLSSITFLGDAPVFSDEIFVNVTATATYPAGNPTWTEDKFVHDGSYITWVAKAPSFCVPDMDQAMFFSLEEAMEAYDPKTQHIRLVADATVSAVLEKNLQLDLNGHNLDGQIVPNGFTVYGFDSTTDQYACNAIGYFSCTDEVGDPIVPRWQFRVQDADTVKRYLTIESPEGYSFHRFYLGITHISLKPASTAFGYRAAFYGDAMVQAQVTSLGYHLWVTSDKMLTCSKTQFQNQLTLRLKDFDVVHYGETPIYASVFMTFKGGFVIETARTSTTMRNMLETVNASYHKYTASQLCAIQDMIRRFPIIKKWDTENLWTET